LVEDETLTDDPSVVGDEAHIVAKDPNGPRGNSTLSSDERDKYSNLILLCKIHHKLVDDQFIEYSVETLEKMKKDHLEWVSKNLDVNIEALRIDEQYASYIDKWMELCELNEWRAWTSFLLSSGQPSTRKDKIESLGILNEYILSRVWPGKYPALEKAFSDFRYVLNDFLKVFMKYAQEVGKDTYTTEKIYKNGAYEEERHRELLERFEYQVDLVEDLVLELTRSANRICDKIRRHLIPHFRLNEGILIVTSGPHMDLTWKTHRILYRSDDEKYTGLRKFMDIRSTRDLNFGSGVREEYFINTGE